MTGTTALPPPDGAPPRTVAIMASLMLAIVPVQLDAMVTATALPEIAGSLGGFDRIAWIATVYLLTMAVGTAAAGRLGDRFGRRAVLLSAQGVFLAGSLWSALAGGMSALLIARAVQGLGAGMTLTSALATTADIAPPDKRARYQSAFGAIAPVSMIAGPWVGGIVTDQLGWRWIFGMNIPVILVASLGVLLLLHLPRGKSSGRIDALGIAAISVTGTGWVLAGSWIGQYGWTSAPVISAAAVGIIGIIATVVVERRAEQPFLPAALVRRRAVAAATVILALTMGAVMMAAINFLPVFLQIAQGRSASDSGLLLLPMLLPGIIVSLVIGRWADRPGRFRSAIAAGTVVVTAGCVLLATMGPGTTVATATVFMIILGAGIGMLFQLPVVLAQNSASAQDVGAVTGGVSFLRTLVGAVGVGTLGSVFFNRFAARLSGSGAPGTADMDAATLDPSTLPAMPDATRDAVVDAAASANTLLFIVAAALSAVAFLASLTIPRIAWQDGTGPGGESDDDAPLRSEDGGYLGGHDGNGPADSLVASPHE